VVRIDYYPKKISYETLIAWFWRCHDPTTLNRQGGDIGTQYRSVVFYQNEVQKAAAQQAKKDADMSGMYEDQIVTEISALLEFFPAEDYHFDYYKKNPNAGYCSYIIHLKHKAVFEHFFFIFFFVLF
jgi:peptide-methionine (S)-S-oxide reductase